MDSAGREKLFDLVLRHCTSTSLGSRIEFRQTFEGVVGELAPPLAPDAKSAGCLRIVSDSFAGPALVH